MNKKHRTGWMGRLFQALLFVNLACILIVGVLRFVPIPVSAFMLERVAAASLAHQPYQLRYRWLPYERISPYAGMAVIASEDQKFFFHHGFDVQAMAHALSL